MVFLVSEMWVVITPCFFDGLKCDTVYHPCLKDRVGGKKEACEDDGCDDENVAVDLYQQFMKNNAYWKQEDILNNKKDQDILSDPNAGTGYLSLEVKADIVHLIGF